MPGCSKIYLNYGATTSIVAKKKGLHLLPQIEKNWATSTTTDSKPTMIVDKINWTLTILYFHS
jgi:hypothetical protein